MFLWRQPIFHNSGGEPVMSQASRALCRESIVSRDIYNVRSSWGCLSPRRRCKVVHIAIVPQDHCGRGASF